MPELDKQEIRSEEMQEVMYGIPGSFLKWGLFLFFAILAILVAGSWFIKKPEVVTVPVVINTQDPPVALVAKTGGKIERMFVSEGSVIEKDREAALIGNTCNYEDLKRLTQLLLSFGDSPDWITVVKYQSPPPGLLLGEIQADYTRFQKGWKQMKDYLEQAYIPAKLELLEKQIEKKIEYNKELAKQKELLTEDVALAKSNFMKDSLLYKRESYSISAKEYDQSRQAYLQKLYSYSTFRASLTNNEADFIRMKESRLDLQVQYEKELRQFVVTMEESLQLLRSSIVGWEEKYLMRSPVTGRVTLTRFRNENQVIKAGETVATVIPDNSTEVIARAVIPASGFGRIETGQEVNIKLSGFPYMQYGVLKGKIYSLSQVPGEDGFIADIELTGGMTSTYREKIRFIHQMDGTADIITEDTRLIYKFINPLKAMFVN